MSDGGGSPFVRGEGEFLFPLQGKLDRAGFDRLLTWCSRNKASDVTIQPQEPVWAEIGGKWRRVTRRALSPAEVDMACVSIYGDNARAEISAGHDLDPAYDILAPALLPEEEAGCRHPLDDPAGLGRVRFRVNITPGYMPGSTGAQLTIRALPSQPIPIGRLGIEPEILANLRPYQGMVLVTGPTGSGKSTLLSSAVRMRLETPGANEKIITFERPIEFVYKGIRSPDSLVFQTDLGQHLRPRDARGESAVWAYAVRNALRRKPSIIVLGEMRDRATMEAALQGALTGHLLMSTLHTIGVPETVRRIVMAFDPSERRTAAIDLLQALHMVVTQLLVDRVGGGKVAVREYMVFDADIRRDLEEAPVETWPARIRRALDARRCVGRSMAQAARELRAAGQIDDTVLRHLDAREATEARQPPAPEGAPAAPLSADEE